MKKNKYIISILSILSMIGLIVILNLFSNVGDIKKGFLDDSQVDGEKNIGTFDIYCNTNITIDDSIANIKVQNSEDNTDKCQIQLIEDSTNKLLYESDIINPGYYIDEVSVFENLDKGKYTGDIIFNIIGEEGEVKSANTVNVSITVI